MYFVSEKYVNKGKLLDKMEILSIDGFLMGTNNKTFQIQGTNVHKIRIMNRKLANPIVSKKVSQRYNKLIQLLTELLIDDVDDDDSGDSYREALNQIEKFRMEVKNKYRDYLMKKELEKMSKQLTILQKEAKNKLTELIAAYEEYQIDNRRNR